MTKLNTESMAFRYQNLARHALVTHFAGSNADVKGLSRDERFALYKKLDAQITEEAFRILKEKGGEIEPLFDEAAINVLKAQ